MTHRGTFQPLPFCDSVILHDSKENNYSHSILSINWDYILDIVYIGSYDTYMEIKGTSHSACDLQIPTIPNL